MDIQVIDDSDAEYDGPLLVSSDSEPTPEPEYDSYSDTSSDDGDFDQLLNELTQHMNF